MAIQDPMPEYRPTEEDRTMEFITKMSSILKKLPTAQYLTAAQPPPPPADETQAPLEEGPIAQNPADARIQAARSAIENQNDLRSRGTV